MRAVALAALLLTNAAFVGDSPRVTNGRPARLSRTVVRATTAGWQALRDRDTGTIVRMWGGSVPVPGALADPAIAERAARAFLAMHLAELAPGARIADFVLASNRIDDGKRTVAFRQTWNGMRVVGGQLHVVIARDRLFAAGSEALPHVTAAVPRDTRRASVMRAEAWVRDAIKRPVAMHATGERVVLPIVRGARDLEYRVADVYDAVVATGDGRWLVYVAPDGEPLQRTSRIAHANGTLRFDVPERRPTGTRVLAPAARANILVSTVATTTGDDGTFTGTLPGTVEPRANGTFVNVINDAGATATAQLSGQPDQNVDWSLASDEQGDAQLTAYVFANLAKARARTMNPIGWLDQVLDVHVNGAGACNAFSTGDAIHFFLANAECENTGRLADVVLHEFGHSFHNQSIIVGAGQFDPSLSEGVSDFFAANFTNDSGIGRGFAFDNAAVREFDPVGSEATFPDDLSGDPHVNGLIVAGALWDLRTAAGIAVTERVYVGILQRAADLTTSYVAALVADDDDADLGNGTPNLCAIEAAFARHGLVPDFAPTAVEVPVVAGRTVSVVVTPATSTGTCTQPVIAGIDLEWQRDGAAETIAMVAGGATWSAVIPPQPSGTVVRYRVVARRDDNTTIVHPQNLADPLYQLFVGEATPIWCDRLDVDPKWMTNGESWEYERPRGHAGDAPVPYTGDAILGTNIVGFGVYPQDQSTSITTPSIDASGFEHVHVQFRRWLTIEDRAFDRAAVDVAGVTVWENATGAPRLDHIDREWRFVDLEVPPGPLDITWSITSDAENEFGGWNLDDVCVVGVGPLDCAEPPCLLPLPDDDGGCCSTSGDPRGTLVLALLVLALLRLRRFRSSSDGDARRQSAQSAVFAASRCSSISPCGSVSALMP